MSNIAEVIKGGQDLNAMLRRALERIIQLYTDKSHFVYELLQNAEDAEAKSIKFVEYEDRLEVYHDGRPFTKANLQGLCDIGRSDKADNLNKIGEFGVGFKSVFGICDTVKLYSNPSHFRTQVDDAESFAVQINDFINPDNIQEEDLESNYTTKFVFPYVVGESFSGYDDVSVLKSVLSSKLQNLGVTTLLFMNNLELIAYEINLDNEEKKGEYLLDKQVINEHCEYVSAIGVTGVSNDEEILSYLKFSRKLPNSPRTVDIAFPVVKTEDGYDCRKSIDPYVSVYFPTETESKLGFIVQGPYRTTPNRSSIPADDKDNQMLANETAILLRSALLELRASKILNMSFVKVLPLNERNFDAFKLFLPLFGVVKDLFSSSAMLPCKNGSYVSAQGAKIARQEKLANLLDDQLLTALINDTHGYHWLPTFLTETNREYEQVYTYLTRELRIGVIRPEDTRVFLTANPAFLPARTDDWLVEFYSILENVPGAFAKSGTNMLSAPIVKTSTGEFVAPYRRTDKGQFIANVFVPTGNIQAKDVNFVDSGLYEKCRHFFDDIVGLEKPNEYELIIKDIKARYEQCASFDAETHIDDIKHILKYLQYPNYKDEISRLVKTIFWVKCKDGKNHKLGEARIYLPINTDGLRLQEYFLNITNSLYFVDDVFYANYGIGASDLCNLGIYDSIFVGDNLTQGTYSTGSKGVQPGWWTTGDFRWKLTLDNIKEVLNYISAHPTAKDSKIKSQTIWKVLLLNETKLVGTVRIGGSTPNLENEPCDLIRILRGESYNRSWNGKWLYTESDELVSHKAISKHDLSPYIYGKLKECSVVYDLLGFKKTEADEADDLKQQIPKEKLNAFFENELKQRFGLNSADIQKKLGTLVYEPGDDEPEQFEFPIVPVKNWEVLKKHAAEMLVYANPVEYEAVVRRIRTSNRPLERKAYLHNMYRCDGSRRYACQICHEATAQIECVELFENPDTELDPINLCLCPNCAALYRGYRSNRVLMSDLRKAILALREDTVCNGEQVIIPVENSELWFAQTHFAEIQELLRLSDEAAEKKKNNHSTDEQQPFDENEQSGMDVYAGYIGKTISRKDGFRGVVTGINKGNLEVKILEGAKDGKTTTSISIDFMLSHKTVYVIEG